MSLLDRCWGNILEQPKPIELPPNPDAEQELRDDPG